MNGGIVIDRTGTVTHTATGAAPVYGILAAIEGGRNNSISIVNRGTISVSGQNAWGVDATIRDQLNAGNITVDVGDVVNTPSGSGRGVFAGTVGNGDVSVTTGAVDGGYVGISAGVEGIGNVSVTTHGAIGGNAAPEYGISTQTHGGDLTIVLGGNVTATLDGIHAVATGTGSVTITGQGDATGGSDAGDDGIDVRVASGNVIINVTGTISGDPGVVAAATTGGPIELSGIGDVIGTGAEAVRLATINGNGNIKLARNGNLTGATDGASLATSGAIGAGTGTGTIDVTVLPAPRRRAAAGPA